MTKHTNCINYTEVAKCCYNGRDCEMCPYYIPIIIDNDKDFTFEAF